VPHRVRRRGPELSDGAAEEFVRTGTAAGVLPLVPEVVLRVTDDLVALWERAERRPGAVAGEPPFWAVGWAGGQGLARHVLDHPDLVHGRRVLDLACGSGLVAIAAALAGGEVTAVDTDPLALAATQVNAQANAVTVRGVCVDLLATSAPTGPGPAAGWPGDVDVSALEVVLAGDVFYARSMAERVEPFLRAAARAGCTVLVGDPHRAYLPATGLELQGRYDVEVTADVEGVTSRCASVFRVLP